MTTSGSVPSAQSTSSNATGSAWTSTDRCTPPVEDNQLRYRTFGPTLSECRATRLHRRHGREVVCDD
jgi:hypothetical protein